MKNLKKTNTTEFKKRIFPFLIDCITEVENENETPERIISDMFARFENETNSDYYLKSFSRVKRLENWISGLPTYLPFNPDDVLKTTKELHQAETLTEAEEEKILSNYFEFYAIQLIKLEAEAKKGTLNRFLTNKK